jgi:hypothetical protein
MRLSEEPLDNWLLWANMLHQLKPEQVNHYRSFVHKELEKLEAILTHNQTMPRARSLTESRIAAFIVHGIGQLSAGDLQWAQQLFWRVVEEGGSGSIPTQESLLTAIALSLNPSISVPFLVQVLDLSRPRDSLKRRRRRLALAALALLAIQTRDATPYAALQQATHHSEADVRGWATGYLGCAYQDAHIPLPPDVQHLFHTIATSDPAFLPRYKARLNLHAAGLSIPFDYPDGVYRFKVKFQHARRIYRTIALRSTDTMQDLYLAIQNAIQWGSDHLYSFFLYGNRGEDRDLHMVGRWEYEHGESDNQPAHLWQIGMLGFTLKHTFHYLFDYGDMHEFEIDVVGIEEQADPGDYPRIVASRGEAPEQYPTWEDEEDE